MCVSPSHCHLCTYILQDIGDLESELERRRHVYSSYGLKEQPLPIIVGPTLSDIHSSYVVVNKIKYSIETPLKAIDTCFKIYQVLNAQYPFEVQIPWTFLQKHIYDISTVYDKSFVVINKLISDLNRVSNTDTYSVPWQM